MQLFFAVTLFVSAGLLFVVQPMFARMVLPLLGGTPAVWNTCMVFYQAALLAGYVYAHLGTRWLGARTQSLLHLALMAAPWLVLPIAVGQSWSPPADAHPAAWLLLLLCASVGLPFFVVSASAPMLQSWFANTGHPSAKDPYYLYAASNLGSMLGLLSYPFLVEPNLTLAQQAWWWAAGYGLLTALTVGCAALLRRSRGVEVLPVAEGLADGSPEEVLGWGRRVRWLALSFAPSSLLLGVTTHISTDLAAVPLLWIVPLTLYLLSFVLVFARWQILPHRWMVRVQPLLILPLSMVFFQSMTAWFWTLIGLHLIVFFVTAMVCHGELARSRPQASRLTEFYLWMSLGGVLGGIFNALLAPTFFPWLGDHLWALLAWWEGGRPIRFLSAPVSPNVFYMILEYPMAVALACMLRPQSDTGPQSPLARRLVFGIPTLLVLGTAIMMAVLWQMHLPLTHRWSWIMAGRPFTLTPQWIILGVMALTAFVFLARPVWFGMGIFMLLIFSYLFADPDAHVIYMQRSFFGVMRISYYPKEKIHLLSHGSTTHGVQIQDPDPMRRNRPQSYYYPTGPLGDIFHKTANAANRQEIGIIGLGTGSTAGYGKAGQRITYFEIDPAVVRIAENPDLFTYLTDCQAVYQILLGDARLRLADVPDATFDLLVVDAFSSDSIPIHLLTREAFALYRRKLKDDGVLAIHVSNRYLDLEPLVGRLAEDAGVVCRTRRDTDVSTEEKKQGKYASDWAAVARSEKDLGKLMKDPEWEPIDIPEGTPCWTDDFSNVIAALRKP